MRNTLLTATLALLASGCCACGYDVAVDG